MTASDKPGDPGKISAELDRIHAGLTSEASRFPIANPAETHRVTCTEPSHREMKKITGPSRTAVQRLDDVSTLTILRTPRAMFQLRLEHTRRLSFDALCQNLHAPSACI